MFYFIRMVHVVTFIALDNTHTYTKIVDMIRKGYMVLKIVTLLEK